MIKRLILLQLILLFSIHTRASEDNWTLYPSYHNSTYCQVAGKKVYILSSGALFSYNTADNEVFLYDKINGLSDINITHISYSDYINALVIIYSNANIDILYDDETIYNITDFKNSNVNNKTINNINIDKNIAYLSTEFGVVVLDLEKLEIKNTYNTGYNTRCAYLFKDKLYTGTDNGLFKCDTTKNMLDKNNWENINSDKIIALCELDNELYVLIKDSCISVLDTNTYVYNEIVERIGGKYHTIYNKDNEIIAPASDKLTIIKNHTKVYVYKTANSNYILKNKNEYWNCKGYKGVYKSKIESNRLIDIQEITFKNSPVRNYCEFMKFTNDDKLLITGGALNYFDDTFYDGTFMEYNVSNHKWFNFPEDTIKTVTKLKYQNICSADEDPTEPGHYFASSFGNGLFEFRDGKFVKHYDFKNSILESAVPNNQKYVRVPTVIFDKEGNLWCINTNNIKDIIKVLKKNGEWVSLNYKEIENKKVMVKPLFDSRGWLWITAYSTSSDVAGLFCANIKNTPFNTSDDKVKSWFDTFTNQDGITYNIYQVPALCEDKNGHMWVGTNTGLFVIDNPDELLNKNGTFKQIKVPRNDGTGLADYLMNNIYIKAIDVDGANRKWVGTLDSGIYLISEDGLETIHHFTTENSPLPSNCIVSIAVNHKTGDVFIGTDKGIACYRSDATRPEEKLEKNVIHAYPNPVRSDYNGNISIVGLTDECNVKIIDTSGYIINEGYSNGGMYSWNGRNKKGEKVSSGVYQVLLYDKNGKEGETTKIVVIR
ncbi:MAG: Por secretion system protein [Bacteroidaceae bacterium]|nr:Por secretion system protein [Bacteroidaceae bacterium]